MALGDKEHLLAVLRPQNQSSVPGSVDLLEEETCTILLQYSYWKSPLDREEPSELVQG